MLTCKITLPDSPHPELISKNPGFRAVYLARQNKFRFLSFNKTIQKQLFFFHFWLLASCSKNLAFARKNGFTRVSGAAAPHGSYAMPITA